MYFQQCGSRPLGGAKSVGKGSSPKRTKYKSTKPSSASPAESGHQPQAGRSVQRSRQRRSIRTTRASRKRSTVDMSISPSTLGTTAPGPTQTFHIYV